MEILGKLFEPIKINKFEIRNRIALAPTGMLACDYDGSINDQNIAHYVARAKGGMGLIIIEHTFATYKYAVGVPRIIGIYHDRQISGMRELADAIHIFGAKAVVQLSLGLGRAAIANQWEERELVAPSAIPYRVPEGSAPKGLKHFEGAVGAIPRELSIEEILELENIFVAGAERVKKAGFEGIEIHGAHGYLIAQFLSPLSNQRHDIYGGTFERRLTLPLNLIRKTREKVGSDFIIGYRISGDEHTPKAREDRVDEIRRCLFCNTCLRLIFDNQCKVRCAANPYVGLERYISEYYPLPSKV